MSKKQEALRLVDDLYVGDFDYLTNHGAAEELCRLHALCEEMGEALEGVVRVADRATDEFDAARNAIAKWKESK